MTGGWIDDKRSAQTEMMTMSEYDNNWKIITTAYLPVPLVNSAALTINNKVYLFGNFSETKQLGFLILLRGPVRLRSSEPDPRVQQQHQSSG